MQIGCRGPNTLQHARLVGASVERYDREASRFRSSGCLARRPVARCQASLLPVRPEMRRDSEWHRVPVGRQSAKAVTGTATVPRPNLYSRIDARDCAEHHVDGIVFFLETSGDEREARSRHRAGLDLPTELIELTRVGADIRDGRGPCPRTEPTQRIGERERGLDLVTPLTALLLVDFSALLGQRQIERPFLRPDLAGPSPGASSSSCVQSIEVDGVDIVEGGAGRTFRLEVSE